MTQEKKHSGTGQDCPKGYESCDGYRIPKEWNIVRFDSLFSRVTRKNDENNQNVLTISAQQGLISQIEYYNTLYASENKTGYTLLHRGDFSYNKSYSSGYAYGAIKRLDAYEKGIVSPLYLCFTPRQGVNSDFYLQYFETGCFDREIYKIAQEGARNHGLLNVSTEDFFHSMLVFPPLEEQERIAEILIQCDRLIELKEQKLDELKQLKKEFLRKMFPAKGCDTPEIRFPGFTGAWEQRKLGEIAKTTIGEFVIKSKQDDSYPYPVFNGGSSNTGYYKEFNNEGNKILVSARGANAGFVNIIKTRYWAGNSCYSVDLLDKNIFDTDFIFQEMKHKQTKFTDNQQAANIPSVSKSDVEKFIVDVPSYSEQVKIGTYFKNLDSLITLHQRELEETKTYKKTLAKLLLTGIVRVQG